MWTTSVVQLWQAQNQTCRYSYSWKDLRGILQTLIQGDRPNRARQSIQWRAASSTYCLSYAAAYTNESIPASIISPLWTGNLRAMDSPSPIATPPPSPTLTFCRAILSVTSLHHIPTVATERSISETARTTFDSYPTMSWPTSMRVLRILG